MGRKNQNASDLLWNLPVVMLMEFESCCDVSIELPVLLALPPLAVATAAAAAATAAAAAAAAPPRSSLTLLLFTLLPLPVPTSPAIAPTIVALTLFMRLFCLWGCSKHVLLVVLSTL